MVNTTVGVDFEIEIDFSNSGLGLPTALRLVPENTKVFVVANLDSNANLEIQFGPTSVTLASAHLQFQNVALTAGLTSNYGVDVNLVGSATFTSVAELSPTSQCSLSLSVPDVSSPSKITIDTGTCDAEEFWGGIAAKVLDCNFSDFLSTPGLLNTLKNGVNNMWGELLGLSGKIILPIVDKEFHLLMQNEVLERKYT